MEDRIAKLLETLAQARDLRGADQQRALRRAAWVAELTQQQLAELLSEVGQMSLPLDVAGDRLLAHWLTAAVQSRRTQVPQAAAIGTADATAVAAQIESLYPRLGPASPSRSGLLAWLAVGGSEEELQLLARLLVADPPSADEDVVQAIAPLFQQPTEQTAAVFPDLLAALAHSVLAAPVLDLANFLTRQKIVSPHPAAGRSGQLVGLLGGLVQSLAQLEEDPSALGDSPQELSRRVARGVALAVSLCDALAQIGDPAATGKLHQALSLGHRRVRTEAAAALARLGDERGPAELAQLAAEPIARLRVLAYAEELGITDRIDPRYTTAEARAEAQLCLYLAEPTQYGVPPATCELIDRRMQFWPGYSEPVECFLFRFQYVLTVEGGERSFSNIGIAGPLAHAFVADLGDLPVEDIYAAFAGWQATHEEIREYEVTRLSRSEQLEVERLKRRLHDAEFRQIEPLRMGYFFGDKALIAAAERPAEQGESIAGVAVADFDNTLFFPERGGRRSLGPDEAYCIYKGRKLLKAFNP
jgi:hypothetical protein